MNDDSTRIMGGTESYPLDTQSAVGIESCPHCQTQIPVGEMFCPKCGYQRDTWGGDSQAGSTEAIDNLADAKLILESSDGQKYAVRDGENILGRGDVDIKITDGYASRSHLKLAVSGEAIHVEDLGSSNGTLLNDEALLANEPREMMVGDTLKIGNTTLTLVANESAAEGDETLAAPAPAVDDEPSRAVEVIELKSPTLAEAKIDLAPAESPWILDRNGEEQFFIRSGETTFGRKAERCDIIVRGDGYISGLHCKFHASETVLEVTDLGSTNGTFVNDDQLEPNVSRQVGAGDMVRLGQTDLMVKYNEIGDIPEETDDEPEEAGEPSEN